MLSAPNDMGESALTPIVILICIYIAYICICIPCVEIDRYTEIHVALVAGRYHILDYFVLDRIIALYTGVQNRYTR